MIQGRKVLALIPARGGSKQLPRKNVRLLAEKPLIAWTIQAARESLFIDEVLVSSDDDEIMKISREYGANIRFRRPDYLASDEASAAEVIIHAMDFLEKEREIFDIVIYLQPTSPLRTAYHIDEAFRLFIEKNATSIVSVVEAGPAYMMNQLPKNLSMKNFISFENKINNRQDATSLYLINGAIYITSWENFKRTKNWFVDNSFAYVMDKVSSIDIDDGFDFDCASYFFEKAYEGSAIPIREDLKI